MLERSGYGEPMHDKPTGVTSELDRRRRHVVLPLCVFERTAYLPCPSARPVRPSANCSRSPMPLAILGQGSFGNDLTGFIARILQKMIRREAFLLKNSEYRPPARGRVAGGDVPQAEAFEMLFVRPRLRGLQKRGVIQVNNLCGMSAAAGEPIADGDEN